MVKNRFIQQINERLILRSFKNNDQVFFAHRLSLLMNSGISIVEALEMLMSMDKSKNHKILYMRMITKIEEGQSLGKSLRVLKITFNYILIALIQNGESSGRLSEALLQASKYLEKKNEMKNKIIGSLIYPFFIVIATLGMSLFLILYIFPKIIPLLQSLDIKLPLITRIVEWIYHFSVHYGIIFVAIFVVVFIILNLFIKRYQKARLFLHKTILSIPILEKHIKNHILSSVCSMGEMLINAGKSIPETVKFYEQSTNNLFYKNIYSQIYLETIRGVSLASALRKNEKYFPEIVFSMCELGERVGSLGVMLGHCGHILEQETEDLFKKFSSLIEPVLMIFMGLVVGSIALSIILPVYEITNHLSN